VNILTLKQALKGLIDLLIDCYSSVKLSLSGLQISQVHPQSINLLSINQAYVLLSRGQVSK